MTTTAADAIDTLNKLAREVARAHPDTDAAAQRLLDRVNSNGLASSIVDAMVWRAARDAVYEAQHAARGACKANVARRGEGTAAAYAVATGIFDRWIIMGMRLGEAGRNDLRDAANAERAKASGHIVNAAFYESLASRVKEGKTVRECVSEDNASKLLAQAGGVA
jgi:hypothetical protein